MRKLISKITAILSAAAMSLTMLGSVPAYAEDSDDLKEYNIEITYDGQIVDTFMGVSAKYIKEYQWSGPYSCAYFVGNFYEKFYGTLMYDINNYQGKPKVYLAGHTAELRVTDSPLPGDVAQNKKYSHVAIVKAVEGDTITLIEQNWKWNDWATGKPVCTVNRKIGINDYYIYRLYIDGKECPIPYGKPSLAAPKVSGVGRNGYTVTASATSDYDITQLRFGTYPKSKGESAIKWTELVTDGTNISASVNVRTENFGDLGDTYVTVVEAVGKNGIKDTKSVETYVDRTAPTISDAKITDVTAEGYTVTCTVSDASGIAKVKFPSWTTAGGKDDIPYNWANNNVSDGTVSGKTATFTVKTKDHNGEAGEYNTEINAYDWYGNVSKKLVSVVINPAEDIKVEEEEIKLEEGESVKLDYELTNSGKTEITDKVNWTSSDSSASVSAGKITADEVGTAVITVKTSAGKTAQCKVTVTKSVDKLDISKIDAQIYTGKELTPELTVKDGSKTLEAGKDYELSYSQNKDFGTAKVKITGKDLYTGSKELSFDILPAPVSELAVSETKTDSVSLTWTASDSADGYIVIAEKDGVKTELGKTSETSFTASGLTSASAYKFSVEAYKTASGKDIASKAENVDAVTAVEQVRNPTLQRCGNYLSILWDREANATAYEVKLVTAEGEESIVETNTPAVISCCFISGVEGERTISVRAFKDIDGERFYGDWSAEIFG